MLIDATDVVLVGGGLSNSLIAHYMGEQHPTLKLHILEASDASLPAKTWSFHVSDVGTHFAKISPLVTKTWDSYDVYFPNYHRTLNLGYASIRPETLNRRLRELKNLTFHYQHPVKNPSHLRSRVTLDGTNDFKNKDNAYQKFLGLNLKLKQPHGLKRPILMDARVLQTDGFRFMYVLPWSDTELLVEETHYSDSPTIDHLLYEQEILEYTRSHGWKIEIIQSRESQSLPIPLRLSPVPGNTLKVGVHGDFFHPVTGYSVPYASRVAAAISSLAEINSVAVGKTLAKLRRTQKSQQDFFLLLNRLMFQSAEPAERYKIFEHFYRFPESFIQRFYRGEMTRLDRLRIFMGKPPVPVVAALKTFLNAKGDS